jgi:hypothetical protein
MASKPPILTEATATRLTTVIPPRLSPKATITASRVTLHHGTCVHYRSFHAPGCSIAQRADIVERARCALLSVELNSGGTLDGILATVYVSAYDVVLWTFVLAGPGHATFLAQLEQLSFEGLSGVSISFVISSPR